MKRVVAVAVVGCVIACGGLVRPVRWEVEGLSMAPGLMPGDVVASGVFPSLARRRPGRFERWTLAAPDGPTAVKRVWGLPGEVIGIVAGDVVVDGTVLLKPPRVLAEMALPVAAVPQAAARGTRAFILPEPVFDDAPFAPHERRLLTPVRDVGLAAVIDVAASPAPDREEVVELRVADRTARARLPRPSRHVVVAGRLDGAFVAAAWSPEPGPEPRSCLPPGAGALWSVHVPWDRDAAVTACEVRIVSPAGSEPRAVIERAVVWRDVHHLPPADGTRQWRLGPDEHLVLGDYPGGSRDSRQWGPVGRDRFRDRLSTVRR